MQRTGRDLWHFRVRETPERTFLHFEGREWSYRQFDEAVRRLAAGLASIGVKPGAPVLVSSGNRPETLQVQLAIQELGAVFVPLLPDLTPAELAFPINHCEARLLIAEPDEARKVASLGDKCPGLTRVIDVGELEDLATAAPRDPAPPPGYGEDTLAAILYTSGSTGRPKGVMLRAGCFFSVGDAFADRFGVTAEDTCFLPTTLAHAVGSLTALSMALQRGARIALVDRFHPETFWDQLVDAGGTFSILFPAHLNLLLEADRGVPGPQDHPMRLVITHAYNKRFEDRFGIELATVWGMTETGALCVGSEPGYHGELGDNYVGVPMKGVEAGVFDHRMKPVAPGESGEIALRHRHVMLGYFKDPDATEATLVDGWVRSGDLGVQDQDGRLFFVGRVKNVIKRSGENVSAEEVEIALMEHPDVAECTVFAVPDPIRTEEVFAAVVGRPGTAVDPAVLRTFCSERLVRWKLPRYIAVLDSALPRLPSGKLDRVALRTSLDLQGAWDAETVTAPSRGAT